MSYVVKVARNGTITIPAELRKKFGVKDGSYLGIEENKDEMRLVKLRIEKEKFIKVVEEMTEIADKKGITRADVVKASKKVGKEVYAEEYGEE